MRNPNPRSEEMNWPLLSASRLGPSDSPDDLAALFTNLHTLLLSHPPPLFSSTSISTTTTTTPRSHPRWLQPSSHTGASKLLLHSLSPPERAFIGGGAGAIAGAFTYVCLLPLDLIKTKMQTRGAAQAYSSALDAALDVLRSHGPLGFYRGVSAVLLGSASSSALYFATCELSKSLLSSHLPPLLIPPTAGATGNIVSSALMVPKELITQRMQAGAPGRSWEVLMGILRQDGFFGLYAGYAATLLRNLPAGILSYSSFEYLKAFVLSRTGSTHLEPAQSVCCGALAGAISASLTTPLDVVKTRLMTRAKGEAGGKVWEMARLIVEEEGWKGLASGIGPRVLHSACFAALGYFAFETARLVLLQHYVQQKAAMAAAAGEAV